MPRWSVVVVFALASCAGSPKPDTPPAAPQAAAPAVPDEDVVARVEGFRHDMCACHGGNAACARKVKQALGEFEESHRDARVPYRELKRLAHLASETDRCAQRALHEDIIGVMTRFKDEMCACAAGDKDCAMRVQEEMQAYAESNRDVADLKMSDDEMKQATDLGMAMAKCSAAAMGMSSSP